MVTDQACLLGLFASVVNAARVNGLWANGDVEGARVASRRAKRYAIWCGEVSVNLLRSP